MTGRHGADLAGEIASLGRSKAHTAIAALLRKEAAANRRLFVLPEVKAWCQSRWRHLFLTEAVKDPIALEVASTRSDKRPERQRIAERFLLDGAGAVLHDEQPGHADARLSRTTLLVCPGLLNGMLPVREFRDDLPRIEARFGMRALRSASHPARSCEANVADVMRALDEGKGGDAAAKPIPAAAARAPGDVAVIAYSKGAPDMLATLVRHPELKSRVRCIFTWAGAIGGSQVADDVARKFKASGFERQAADISFRLKAFAHSFMRGKPDGDQRIDEFDTVAAVRDLTTGVRQAFLREHGAVLDGLDIPIFTFRGVTQLSEVPFSQRGGCKLLSTFEAQHDMQVAGSCSKLPFPMATELAVLHGHHWDIAYPAFRERRWLNNTYHPFPKTAAITAMVQLGAELGLID